MTHRNQLNGRAHFINTLTAEKGDCFILPRRTPRRLPALLLLAASLAGCTMRAQDRVDTTSCDSVTSPVFSLRSFDEVGPSTITEDPPDNLNRRHRAADLLIASGLGDELFGGDPGPGPDVHVEASDVLAIPAPDADIADEFWVEVDSVSAAHEIPDGAFYLAFSVHSTSQGTGRGGRYNVSHQVQMNHREADVFFGLPEINLALGAVPANANIDPLGVGIGNTLSLDPCHSSNQRDFDLAPRVPRDVPWPRDHYDDTDALDYARFAGPGAPFPNRPLYFTVDTGTAARLLEEDLLPDWAFGGSDILVRERAGLRVWADNDFMSLWTDDDIDALLLFENGDGEFGVDDVILLSLAEGSPTLVENGWSPADVLMVTWQNRPSRLVEAADLGLRVQDEMDALTVVTDDGAFAAGD